MARVTATLSTGQRLFVFAAMAVMISEAALIPALVPRQVIPAVAVDLVLWTGVVLALLARAHGGWESLGVRRSTWFRGLAYGATVAGAVARLGGVRVPIVLSVLVEVVVVALVITGVVQVPPGPKTCGGHRGHADHRRRGRRITQVCPDVRHYGARLDTDLLRGSFGRSRHPRTDRIARTPHRLPARRKNAVDAKAVRRLAEHAS
jgi:hypothetical protein